MVFDEVLDPIRASCEHTGLIYSILEPIPCWLIVRSYNVASLRVLNVELLSAVPQANPLVLTVSSIFYVHAHIRVPSDHAGTDCSVAIMVVLSQVQEVHGRPMVDHTWYIFLESLPVFNLSHMAQWGQSDEL